MSTRTVAEQVGEWAAALQPRSLPKATQSAARRLMLDVTGLCVAARKGDYIKALSRARLPKEPRPRSAIRGR